jgi:hypothetical protein
MKAEAEFDETIRKDEAAALATPTPTPIGNMPLPP